MGFRKDYTYPWAQSARIDGLTDGKITEREADG